MQISLSCKFHSNPTVFFQIRSSNRIVSSVSHKSIPQDRTRKVVDIDYRLLPSTFVAACLFHKIRNLHSKSSKFQSTKSFTLLHVCKFSQVTSKHLSHIPIFLLAQRIILHLALNLWYV
jgi:hypothetical protein